MSMPRMLLLFVALALPAGAAAVDAAAREGVVGSAEIARLVEQAVTEGLEGSLLTRGASAVEVKAGSLDSRLRFAACVTQPRIEADLSRPNGRINAKLSCAGPTPWSIYVPVEIHVYRGVVVTTRALQRGQRIGQDDVSLEERDVLANGGHALLDLGEAIGQTPRRNLPTGFTLSSSSIEMPILVKRGERLNLAARAGGITVTAAAEAMSDGRSGEQIRVRNLQSRRIIDATVTGPGRAEAI
jgi:flagella basal body P-ring formation protein FlgA